MLMLSLVLHLAFIYALLVWNQPVARLPDSDRSLGIEIRLLKPQPTPLHAPDVRNDGNQQRGPRSRPIAPPAESKLHSPHPPSSAAAKASEAVPIPVPKEPEGTATSSSSSSPLPNSDQLLESAKRDLGKIDRELRKANPIGREKSLGTSQSALEKGIAGASATVRPKWYEAAKIEELSTGGLKRYKIITGSGLTYCITDPGDGSPKYAGLCAEIAF